MLMHRDTARAICPIDTTLPRLEDLDWFLRFGLIGGRLKVADFVGAEIEVGHKPDPARLDEAAAALRRKWLAPGRGERLPAGAGRRLAAYLQLEQASARLAAGHYAGFAAHLARSFLLAPAPGFTCARGGDRLTEAECGPSQMSTDSYCRSPKEIG